MLKDSFFARKSFGFLIIALVLLNFSAYALSVFSSQDEKKELLLLGNNADKVFLQKTPEKLAPNPLRRNSYFHMGNLLLGCQHQY